MPAKRPDSIAEIREELRHGDFPFPLLVKGDAQHSPHAVVMEAAHLLELLLSKKPGLTSVQ